MIQNSMHFTGSDSRVAASSYRTEREDGTAYTVVSIRLMNDEYSTAVPMAQSTLYLTDDQVEVLAMHLNEVKASIFSGEVGVDIETEEVKLIEEGVA